MFNFLKKRNSKRKDFKEIKDFLIEHLHQLDKSKDKIPSHIFDVTRFFIEETLDTYESMDILMRENHFYGCIAMSRTILENSINLQYIYKDQTEKRARNFKLASTESFLKRNHDHECDNEGCESLKKSLQDQLKDYTPDNKTIKAKFEEVNSQSLYKDAYKRLSEYVHGNYKIRRDLNDRGPYFTYLKRLVFSDTLLVVLEALTVVCERYDLDGGIMIIDDPGYKGIIYFSTNPKKHQNEIENSYKAFKK